MLFRSNATYVVRSTTFEVSGVTIGVVPFSRGRLREPIPDCDILVTHVPPKGVLDKCYNGDRAGSRYITEAVCASLVKPRLWLCGHIHEGYGYEVARFGGGACQPTLVVNAANANATTATSAGAACGSNHNKRQHTKYKHKRNKCKQSKRKRNKH